MTYQVFTFYLQRKKGQIAHKDMNREDESVDFDNEMVRRLTELKKKKKVKKRQEWHRVD